MFEQADRLWPHRSIASDGSIGDADHRTRKSDHNPDASGDVLAGDLTDDKGAGCDADAFAEYLRLRRDRRVKLVINNGQFFSSYATSTRPAWTWVPYNGVNGHFSHCHVSVLDTWDAKNDTSPWFFEEEDMPFTEEQLRVIIRDECLAVVRGEGISKNVAETRSFFNSDKMMGEIRRNLRRIGRKLGLPGSYANLSDNME